jgi:acetyl esterase
VAVAVFLHGGGWFSGTPLQFEHQSQELARQNISSLSIEYRVHKRHGTSVHESISDVLDAITFLRAWSGSLPMVAVGASSGGLLAFHLVMDARFPAAGVVLLNPVLDLSAKGFANKATPFGGDEAISPLHMPVPHFPPCLIVHGTNDGITPLSASQRFASKLAASGFSVELEAVPLAPHGFFNGPLHQDKITQKIAQFIYDCAAPDNRESRTEDLISKSVSQGALPRLAPT